ncbi:GNAT family N-acetyltransferase [Nocardia niwae]|uniref:GNAT family N-acetyltransferase n=1 Tax=Nocardia niwae TaxID=626084 RepID=A0ABV2XGD8_9NOCA|nr:GNAT family N-acetyltransferase [Nocardia niwae]
MSALLPDVVAAEVFAAGAQPVLSGDSVLLRPWTNADAAVVQAVYQDPDIQRWHVREVVSEAEALELIGRWRAGWRGGDGPQWAVVVGGVVAARVGLRGMSPPDGSAGIAYWAAPGWRGRGVTPAAVGVVTRWAFEVGFHRLEVSHSVRNLPSCRAAVKAGFAPEGVRRSAGLHADGWHDMHLHARICPP